jgi:hypothetical protein
VHFNFPSAGHPKHPFGQRQVDRVNALSTTERGIPPETRHFEFQELDSCHPNLVPRFRRTYAGYPANLWLPSFLLWYSRNLK